MGTKDLRFRGEALKTSGGDLEVYALETAALIAIIQDHGEAIERFIDGVRNSEEDFQLSVPMIVRSISGVAPDLLAKVIAYGSREYDDEAVEACRHIPFPEAIIGAEQILRLTFSGEDAVKNFVEVVIRALFGMTETMTALNSPSGDGSTISEAA